MVIISNCFAGFIILFYSSSVKRIQVQEGLDNLRDVIKTRQINVILSGIRRVPTHTIG